MSIQILEKRTNKHPNRQIESKAKILQSEMHWYNPNLYPIEEWLDIYHLESISQSIVFVVMFTYMVAHLCNDFSIDSLAFFPHHKRDVLDFQSLVVAIAEKKKKNREQNIADWQQLAYSKLSTDFSRIRIFGLLKIGNESIHLTTNTLSLAIFRHRSTRQISTVVLLQSAAKEEKRSPTSDDQSNQTHRRNIGYLLRK